MIEQNEINKIISEHNNIVFFGGAGVSTESNIPDFRSANGIYSEQGEIPPERIVSHSYFSQHNSQFFKFYFSKMVYTQAQPNAAHYKLAEMERAGKLKAIITQNIDGLHQKAGSKNVLELHGSVLRNYCQNCNAFYTLEKTISLKDEFSVPHCVCGGIIKPDVVLYEEPLAEETINRAICYIHNADLLIVGGTSLSVYPAAGLINYTKAEIMLINKSTTPYDNKAKWLFNQPIGELFSKITL